MSYEDRHTYELSLKYYRDFINVMDTAKTDAKKEGIEEGKFLEKIEIANAMLQEGFDVKTIVKITGLTKEMILQ